MDSISIIFLSIFASILIYGFLNYKQLDKSIKTILFLVGIALITEILNYLCALYLKNNLFISHIYTVIEFNFLALAYHYEIDKRYRNVLVPLSLFFTTISFTNAIFWQPLMENLNSNTVLLESIFFTLLTFIFFYEFIKGDNNEPLYKYSFLWISIGFLLYFIGNLFTSGLYNRYLIQSKESETIQIANISLNFIQYVCIFMAVFNRQHLSYKKNE